MILTGGNKEKFIHPGSLTAGTGTGTVADDVLTCSTAGTFYARSNQAHGEWEFEVEKGADGNIIAIPFISDRDNIVGDAWDNGNYSGYHVQVRNNEGLRLAKNTYGGSLSFFYLKPQPPTSQAIHAIKY